MNITAILIFLIWLACGVLVVRFVLHTGGHTIAGHVAHWFGGAFVMVGLAVGMVWLFSVVDGNFRDRVNVYVLTHQIRPASTQPLIQHHTQGKQVTVYRPGSVNNEAELSGDQLLIDERQTIRTSLWWVLWSAKYSVR